MTLADVQWQEAATDQMDGYDLAIRYNATATYTGTATSKYATGYTVTADYKGEITRTDCDTVIYTAIFASHGETQNAELTEAGTEAESKDSFDARLVLIPLGAVFLGGAGGGGWRCNTQSERRMITCLDGPPLMIRSMSPRMNRPTRTAANPQRVSRLLLAALLHTH